MQIRTVNLSKIFDRKKHNEFQALKDVNTFFEQGEFVTIIGHTGSGKTTFIEHLNALQRPTSGEVILNFERQEKTKSGAITNISEVKVITNGRRKIKRIKDIRSKVGIAFQFAEYQLFEETILKDIIFGPVNMKVPKAIAKEQAKKYIELVGLDQSYLERSPFALSGGQKRRVALAGILAMEPDFLIMDEPTAGLDPQGSKDMYEIFEKLHKLGKTIIIVTHNLDHVLQHSDRTIMFRKGKIIRDTNSLELMYEAKFLRDNELEPPKLSSFVLKLEEKGLKIGKIRSVEELSQKLTKK